MALLILAVSSLSWSKSNYFSTQTLFKELQVINLFQTLLQVPTSICPLTLSKNPKMFIVQSLFMETELPSTPQQWTIYNGTKMAWRTPRSPRCSPNLKNPLQDLTALRELRPVQTEPKPSLGRLCCDRARPRHFKTLLSVDSLRAFSVAKMEKKENASIWS